MAHKKRHYGHGWWKNNKKEFHRLEIPKKVYDWIRALTTNCPLEMSGFGRTTIREENEEKIIRVESLEVFRQECSPASTVLDDIDLTNMYLDLAKNGKDASEYNFWWHTHADFGVFFSGTDTHTLRKLSTNEGLAVALCTNHKGDKVATVYRNEIEVGEDLEIVILGEIDDAIITKARATIADKVNHPEYLLEKKQQKIEEGDNADEEKSYKRYIFD